MPTSDAAFLAEVEDFLVSCDVPTVPFTTLTDQVNTNSTDEKREITRFNLNAAKLELLKAKDRKRQCEKRERRRHDKYTLQQQVKEYTNEIKNATALTTWGTIAKHQLQARLNAEAEQRRLRSAIESRTSIISDFRGFMQSKLSNGVSDVDGDHAESLFKSKRIRLESSDAEFFRVYLRELDSVFEQTDGVLSTLGLTSVDVSPCDPRRRWRKNNSTDRFTYTDKHLVPFDFKRVCQHIWDATQLQHRQEDRQYFVISEDFENTVAFKFRITTHLKSGRIASIMQRSIARRYVEEDRTVVIWRSFTEGEGLFTGMQADETGWCVAVPSFNAMEPSTLLRTMIRHVPMHFNTATTSKPATEQFTDFLLSAGSEDASEIGTRLETLLIQDE